MEILGYVLSGILLISVALEKFSKNLALWTALFKAIGKVINAEVIDRLDTVEQTIKQQQKEIECKHAIEARVRIIRFGDEILHGTHHSKDYFDQILLDITDYEQYCEKDPEFKNNITTLTIERIKDVYRQCMVEHDFL